MTIQRLEHIGIVVDDLAAAIEFFVALGLERNGEFPLEGGVVDRIVGLEGCRTDNAFLKTPDGQATLELTKFHAPPYEGDRGHAPSNKPGIRHILFSVDDIDAAVAGVQARGYELVGELEQYENSYRLCYIRGPAGIIVELAQKLG
jgi:catechol 2,3-dioxygenase-like lactoylglutathione lyase family enzyme